MLVVYGWKFFKDSAARIKYKRRERIKGIELKNKIEDKIWIDILEDV